MSRRTKPKPPEPAPLLPPSSRTPLIVAVVLAVLCIAVFAQVRHHQFLNYDDTIYVTENRIVQRGLTADGIAWAFTSLDFNWHPVTWLSHMLDVELFGVHPGRHLLVNLAFHLANTLLLFFLLARITGQMERSAFVAALFAIHPLHVESVAWLSERKDVLSALFMLLTLWFYAEFVRTRSKNQYFVALLFFALGLMSKGMLVTLPFVLLLVDYWPLKRFELHDGRAIAKLVVEKIPFFLLLIPSIAMTIVAQRAAGAVATTHSVGERIANAIVSYGAYLWKTVWPTGLAIPYPWRKEIEPMHIAIAALVLVAISVAAFVLAREKRPLFTGWFWFAGMLVPVIGIIQIGSQSMADRYTYLPHIGLFIAIVWLVADALTIETRQLAAVVGAAAVIALAIVAGKQVAHWRNSVTLFAHTINVTGPNSIAHVNLGSALQDAGDPNAALQQLQAGVTADPTSADALVQLARVELQLGRNQEAVAHLQKASSIQSTPETTALLATARGDNASSLDAYAKAIAAEPTEGSLRNDYAAALARAGRDEEALAQYREAIRLSPALYDAHMNHGALLARLGRTGEARESFTTAASIRPGSPEPHVYLAVLSANSGRLDLALASAETAMSIDPVQANQQFTNAVRMPFKETNLQEFVALLQSKR